MQLTKEKSKNVIDTLAVLWIILSTGSLVFCIFNMKLSMFILLGSSLLYLTQSKGIKKKEFYTACVIIAVVVLNSLFNFRYLSLTDDVIIFLIRLFSLMLICSNLSKRRFFTIYCKILLFLCVLSLICFLLTEIGISLPGQHEIWFKGKYYIYTFYHTVGRWTIFHRNAGIFWEAPAFAIFINFAILFLMVGDNDIQEKRRVWMLIVYSATILTTLATTAYIEYLFCLLVILLNRRNTNQEIKSEKKFKYTIAIIVLALLIGALFWENSTHIIENKLINRQGSYLERSNDTIEALKLVLQRPILGFGLFNNYTHDVLVQSRVTDNSNSFSTMILYFGIPLATLYYGYLAFRLRKLFSCTLMSFLCILGAFFVMLNSEQIAVMTLFMFFLFPLQNDKTDSRWADQDYEWKVKAK